MDSVWSVELYGEIFQCSSFPFHCYSFKWILYYRIDGESSWSKWDQIGIYERMHWSNDRTGLLRFAELNSLYYQLPLYSLSYLWDLIILEYEYPYSRWNITLIDITWMIWCDSVGRAQVLECSTLKVIEYVDNTESYTRAISGSSSSEYVILNVTLSVIQMKRQEMMC